MADKSLTMIHTHKFRKISEVRNRLAYFLRRERQAERVKRQPGPTLAEWLKTRRGGV